MVDIYKTARISSSSREGSVLLIWGIDRNFAVRIGDEGCHKIDGNYVIDGVDLI